MRIRRTGVGLLGGLALLVWAAGGTALAADGSVRIAGFAFVPDSISITVGDSVTWTNEDSTAHTATGAAFDTETLSPGESATITFSSAGTFAYACAIHPAMTGSVVVAAASGGGGGGGAALTPAPTDTVRPADADGRPDAWTIVAVLLAIAGATMIGTTVLLERRRSD